MVRGAAGAADGGWCLAALLEPLICAAIYEQDTSRNRHFVEAAVRGVRAWRTVHERLLWYMRQGVDAEKAGAMRALYWCPPPDADSVKETARGLLDAFQRETDLDVRRTALVEAGDDRLEEPWRRRSRPS